MATSRPRRGPAPIASFDHDVSDEVRLPSSPETKQTFQLPEIREDPGGTSGAGGEWLGVGVGVGVGEPRARSLSTPGLRSAAPRIDISRASSSSHQDSRDSSPELALFAGAGGERARLELGFREDGALELRSSTEELAFLEGAPGPPPPPAPAPRRHSRKDSQGSEAALLAVSGRTSRISSVGSQCSAQSALSALSHASRVSRLSVASGASRSPSPHRMLLETSFCGPKPIETDPEVCAAAVEERLRELAGAAPPPPPAAPPAPPAPPAEAGDARDRREVRTEATVEPTPAPRAPDKRQKESRNRADQRRARPRERRTREPEPEVYRSANRTKDVIRIRLRPDDEDEDDEEEPRAEGGPARAERPTALRASPGPPPRSPSPAGPPVSRKSSFCSLFKSRETVGSPESPSEALRRKKSLTEGRSRSRSRDRSATPAASGKLRGSVLSLFRTPRRGAASPSPGSRAASPAPAPAPAGPAPAAASAPRLRYYEESTVIHIPLRTPPDEETAGEAGEARKAGKAGEAPASRSAEAAPVRRTVLPDGSVIIPLHSPTERDPPPEPEPEPPAQQQVKAVVEAAPAPAGRSRRQRLVFTTHVGSAEQVFSTQFSLTKTPSVTSEISESLPSFNEEVRPTTLRDTHITSAEPTPMRTPSETRPSPNGSRTSPGDARRFSGDSRHSSGDARHFSGDSRHSSAETRHFSGDSRHSPGDARHFSGDSRHSPGDARHFSGDSRHSPGDARHSPGDVRHSPGDARHSPGDTRQFPGPSRGASRPGPGAERAEGEELSSGSEGSSEARDPPTGGNDAEQRVLVVQESFEEELPYVPTTLPLERSLALPMVPVRERGAARHATVSTSVSRPRGAAPALQVRAPPSAPPPSAARIRIRLPRRPSAPLAPPPLPSPPRSSIDNGHNGGESRAKPEWIDFEEVPERRKQPKRIQTLPGAGGAGAGGVAGTGAGAGGAGGIPLMISYVEPDECRCECHHATPSPPSPSHQLQLEPASSPSECGVVGDLEARRSLTARPFIADFDLRPAAETRGSGAGSGAGAGRH